MDYFELKSVIENWAQEKGIIADAEQMDLAMATLQKTSKLCNAINNDERAEIIEAIGEIMVTLIIQAKMQDISLESCLELAYNGQQSTDEAVIDESDDNS
jgi:uncharacterized protein YabN with tetrapyrrole methylase and pyrophosphatase domain